MRIGLLALALLLAASLQAGASSPKPLDKNATPETVSLFQFLGSKLGKGILFGHQATNMYGAHWFLDGTSNVEAVTGKFPAVYGSDFCYLEKDIPDPNILAQKTIEAHERGSIVTYSWHMLHPLTGGPYNDPLVILPELLPGGSLATAYKEKLDWVANYFLNLKDKSGRLIPVLFRPLHEADQLYFWWSRSSPEEYKRLWQFTVTYLRDIRQVHNLLYVYSGVSMGSPEFLNRYPGADYVDMIGMDYYFKKNWATRISHFKSSLRKLLAFSESQGKIPAITEFGIFDREPERFWNYIFPTLLGDKKLQIFSYIMGWHNASPEDSYVPYPGSRAASEFLQFARNRVLQFAPVSYLPQEADMKRQALIPKDPEYSSSVRGLAN